MAIATNTIETKFNASQLMQDISEAEYFSTVLAYASNKFSKIEYNKDTEQFLIRFDGEKSELDIILAHVQEMFGRDTIKPKVHVVYKNISDTSYNDNDIWQKLIESKQVDRKSTRLNSSHVRISY